MRDLIEEVFSDALEEAFESSNTANLTEIAKRMEELLSEAGYILVPIEDPTNLFGIQEDSL